MSDEGRDEMEQDFFDTIKRLVIQAMFSKPVLGSRLVLKGGNLMDIVLNISTRSSMDVDFSIADEFSNVDDLKNQIAEALTSVFNANNLNVFGIRAEEKPRHVSQKLKDFWGGYHIEFKIIESTRMEEFAADMESLRRNATVVGREQRRKFEIDISKYEYCDPKESTDVGGVEVFHYSPEMLAFEKIRAICQQKSEYLAIVKGASAGRARDYVDIHRVREEYSINFSSPLNQELLTKVFRAKHVSLHLIARVGDRDVRDFHRADFVAVKDTIKPGVVLEEFDFYVDYLVRCCRDLKPLWNE